MHGNVREWLQDGWNSTYYGQSSEKSAVDPDGPSNSGFMRVVRGGSVSFFATACRSSVRGGFGSSDSHRSIGFRMVLVVDAVRQSLSSKTGP